MLNVLADSGPLGALFNRRDKHHARALQFFKAHEAALRCHTTWEVDFSVYRTAKRKAFRNVFSQQ